MQLWYRMNILVGIGSSLIGLFRILAPLISDEFWFLRLLFLPILFLLFFFKEGIVEYLEEYDDSLRFYLIQLLFFVINIIFIGIIVRYLFS